MQDGRLDAILPHPLQVVDGIFRPRQQDHVGAAQLLDGTDVAHTDAVQDFQRVEIGIVRHARHLDDSNVDEGVLQLFFGQAVRQAVFILDVHMQHGQHPDDGDARLGFQHIQAGLEDADVAAEFIDDDAFDHGAFFRVEEHDRAVHGREDAAAVNIGHEQDGRLGHAGHAHVDDILVLQVDFRRAAGAFNDNDVVLGAQGVKGFLDIRDEILFIPVIFHGGHRADGFSVDDDLGPTVAGRLQQDRIHAYVRLDAGRFGLHDLGPPHLRPLDGNEGIQRHILRFKGCHLISRLMQDTAQPRRDEALARIGHRSLHHDCFSHFVYPPSL